MPEVTTRVVRSSYRDRDGDYSSDDERSSSYGRSRVSGGGGSYRTVQRYRVTPSRVEEVEDDRRSSRLDIPRGDRIEIDRRVERFVEPERIERPRSSIDIRPQSSYVERYVEREREPIREPERERTRTVVYERERDRPREPESVRHWDRRDRPWESERDVRETDVTIEKRVERREEPRREEPRREEPYEVERYKRETEYYDRPDPSPQPIVIRQRAPEQKIIVQEAPPPPPIYLPREEQGFQVIRRAEGQEVARQAPRREEDAYYYRRDVREMGPRRDDDYAIGAYDRREVRPRDSVSDGGDSDGSDYLEKRKIVTTREERSRSPHHKRHLAEGALAGAGVAALLANHREKTGNAPEHRGRNVIGGAALGAIGTELVTRARSRYREREDRSRSRSSSRHSHHRVKTALGLAVAGLATAAAVKYVQNRNANKEEMGRGRSRTRSVSRRRGSGGDDDDDDSDPRPRSGSKHDPKHRAAQMAKAGVATAALAGVVEHFRSKSRKRSGERSRSRLRTGAEIAGAGLAGAAVAGLYENRKAKEDQEQEAERARRERRRSRSRARSTGAYSDPGVDPELGMVEYGTQPVYTQPVAPYRGYDYDPALAAGAAGAAYGANRPPSRSHHRHHSSSSSDDRRHRSRSRSRVRDIAGAAAATGAAAIGVHQYKKRREKKEAERERERRRYEEEAPPENYYANDRYDDNYSPSPPHASGGSYYPATNEFAPPPQAGFTPDATAPATHLNEPPIPSYNPQDYAAPPVPVAPHDPFGYPPPKAGDNVSSNIPPSTAVPLVNMERGASEVPYFPPPPTAPLEPNEHLRDEAPINNPGTPPSPGLLTPASSRSISPFSTHEVDQRPHNKSVMFAPLSPTSSRRLDRIHATKSSPTPSNSGTHKPSTGGYADDQVYDDPSSPDQERRHRHHRHRTSGDEETGQKRRRRRRRNSDPSSDRPNQPSQHRRRNRNPSRSPSPPASSDVEELPPRFDKSGRPLDGSRGLGGAGQGDIVEKIMHDFGDVVDGRKSWKDLLGGLMEGGGLGALGGGGGGGSGAGSGSDRESGSRRKRRN